MAIQIQACLDSYFLIVFRTVYFRSTSSETDNDGETLENAEYSALVMYVGNKELAKTFAYRFAYIFYKHNINIMFFDFLFCVLYLYFPCSKFRMELERDGRRVSWEAVPLSISEGHKRAMNKGDCFCFNYKTMLLFRNADTDMLPIDVTITKL